MELQHFVPYESQRQDYSIHHFAPMGILLWWWIVVVSVCCFVGCFVTKKDTGIDPEYPTPATNIENKRNIEPHCIERTRAKTDYCCTSFHKWHITPSEQTSSKLERKRRESPISGPLARHKWSQRTYLLQYEYEAVVVVLP